MNQNQSQITEEKLRAFGFREYHMQFDTIELAIEALRNGEHYCS